MPGCPGAGPGLGPGAVTFGPRVPSGTKKTRGAVSSPETVAPPSVVGPVEGETRAGVPYRLMSIPPHLRDDIVLVLTIRHAAFCMSNTGIRPRGSGS